MSRQSAVLTVAIVAASYAAIPMAKTTAQQTQSEKPPANAPVPIRSEVEGSVTILELLADGSHVEAGDVVATLDASALRIALEDQQLKLKQAELTFQVTQRTLRLATLEAHYAQAMLTREDERLDQVIANAKTDAQVAHDQAKNAQRLFDKQMNSAANVQAASYRVAQADHAFATALREKKLATEVSQELQTLRHQIDIENAQGDEIYQQAVVDLERIRLARIEDQIAKCQIKAPITGTLQYPAAGSTPRPIETGAAVHERQWIASVVPAGAKPAR